VTPSELWYPVSGAERRLNRVARNLIAIPAAVAGSQSIGTTAYAIPGGAIFATAASGTGGAGTLASPYQSAATAVAAAPAGTSTIVLRGGSYNESITTPTNKSITFQAYPNEAVWFDSVNTKARFLIATGPTHLKGIGIKRYTGGGTSDSQGAYAMGFYGGSSAGSYLENCVFDSSGLDGLKIGVNNCSLKWVTFRNSQRTGFQATQCDGMVVNQCASIHNNLGGYAAEPETAGMKFTRCDQTLITQNWVEDCPGAYGIWYDVWCTRMKVAANVVPGGTGSTGLKHCIEIELSDGGNFNGQNYGYVVGNKVTGASYAGVKLLDSGYVHVGNNDMRTSAMALWMQQDNREHGSTDYRTPTECPAHCLGNPFVNNIYDGGTGFTAYDAAGVFNYTGGQMLGRVGGNWSSGSQMGSLGAVGGSRSGGTFTNPADMASASVAVGGPLNLGTNVRNASRPADTIAEPLSAAVADLLSLPVGTQLIGPNTSILPTLREAA
jgi:hypothetical protein